MNIIKLDLTYLQTTMTGILGKLTFPGCFPAAHATRCLIDMLSFRGGILQKCLLKGMISDLHEFHVRLIPLICRDVLVKDP